MRDQTAARQHPGSMRVARTAAQLVAAAEEHLCARPSRPIYLDDLCQLLDVSCRTLHLAFVAARGMSPGVYLKRQRLMMVRQALESARSKPPLVKSVALDHGFWHLGHFARDYRELFGETPSETVELTRRAPGPAIPHEAAACVGAAWTECRRRDPVPSLLRA
jgi:AraC family ethanolamine operon transcriptional activator